MVFQPQGIASCSLFSCWSWSSTNICICGGMLDDISLPEQGGRSMRLYIPTPSLGATIGPVIRGFIMQGTTWRFNLYCSRTDDGCTFLHFKKRMHRLFSKRRYANDRIRLWVLLDKLAVPQEIIPERHVLMQRANTLPELNIPLSYA